MSSPIPVWTGIVTPDGALKLDARDLFRAYVRRLKNTPITLVLKRRARAKSSQQLGYLFGVVYPVLAEHFGYRDYEVDEVHDAVARELRGLKPDPNPLGLRWSLREQDHEDVSRYIEDVRHWALMKHGCVTPDAEQAEPVATKRRAAA